MIIRAVVLFFLLTSNLFSQSDSTKYYRDKLNLHHFEDCQFYFTVYKFPFIKKRHILHSYKFNDDNKMEKSFKDYINTIRVDKFEYVNNQIINTSNFWYHIDYFPAWQDSICTNYSYYDSKLLKKSESFYLYDNTASLLSIKTYKYVDTIVSENNRPFKILSLSPSKKDTTGSTEYLFYDNSNRLIKVLEYDINDEFYYHKKMSMSKLEILDYYRENRDSLNYDRIYSEFQTQQNYDTLVSGCFYYEYSNDEQGNFVSKEKMIERGRMFETIYVRDNEGKIIKSVFMQYNNVKTESFKYKIEVLEYDVPLNKTTNIYKYDKLGRIALIEFYEQELGKKNKYSGKFYYKYKNNEKLILPEKEYVIDVKYSYLINPYHIY